MVTQNLDLGEFLLCGGYELEVISLRKTSRRKKARRQLSAAADGQLLRQRLLEVRAQPGHLENPT